MRSAVVIAFTPAATHHFPDRALSAIAPGDEITHAYVDAAQPTRLRRARLFDSHFFVCRCKRCSSPPPIDKLFYSTKEKVILTKFLEEDLVPVAHADAEVRHLLKESSAQEQSPGSDTKQEDASEEPSSLIKAKAILQQFHMKQSQEPSYTPSDEVKDLKEVVLLREQVCHPLSLPVGAALHRLRRESNITDVALPGFPSTWTAAIF